MRPSRCQYCGGVVRSPHALGRRMVWKRKKSKPFVRRSIIHTPRRLMHLLLTIY